MNKLLDILSMDENELNEYILSIGEKKFRAKQIFTWLHQKNVKTMEEMTDLPKTLIERLKRECYIQHLEVVKCAASTDGTKKYLFKLRDDQMIESVFMPYKHGNSVCISSQVGCKMGCSFCASTIGGLIRPLRPSEMLEQIYEIEALEQAKVSNIVVMGTGEPFDSYDELLRFIYLINSKEGRNIGARSITVSTCGIVPKIMDFADEDLQVNLAISLHAPTDELRKQLMPVAHRYDLDSLMESCRYYIKKTNRRITFEYSLIHDVNDSMEMARTLAQLLRGMLCHVNLIPVNQVEGKVYKKSEEKTQMSFKNILEKAGIPTTVRRSLGNDVDAACGQLRRRYETEQS